MPVYRLREELVFPPPELGTENGLLAVGGDLSPARLLLAYSMGIFPWFSDNDPLLWWSPDPRCVLFPQELRVSRSLNKLLRQERFSVTFNQTFGEVIKACSSVKRKLGEGTWITSEMLEAYQRLHRLGYAHSIEAWQDGQLAGGLYGVSLGRFFFGESMFHRVSNASKVAFVTLVRTLQQRKFILVDCQMPSQNLQTLGARNISRKEFLTLLQKGALFPSAHPERSIFPIEPDKIIAA
jgi:leucyl/phenylalanyl-tRNA---protein transferase